LWFIPITEVLTDVINNRLIDTSGFSFSNNGGIAVTSTGLFTQQAASTSYFDISAKPISPTSSLTAVKPITLKNKGISPTTLDNETQSHTLIGGLGNDYIRGYAAGTNDIRGNEGNDTLISGSNGDVLSGGLGADIFKFIDLAHKSTSITSGEDIDTILDFSNTDHDKIDLSKIDANSKIRGNQEFKFIGTNNFSKSPIGQLRFDVQTHSLYGHTNTDKIPDFVIHLSGINSLSTEDIVL